jgi:hypothetical protein
MSLTIRQVRQQGKEFLSIYSSPCYRLNPDCKGLLSRRRGWDERDRCRTRPVRVDRYQGRLLIDSPEGILPK